MFWWSVAEWTCKFVYSFQIDNLWVHSTAFILCTLVQVCNVAKITLATAAFCAREMGMRAMGTLCVFACGQSICKFNKRKNVKYCQCDGNFNLFDKDVRISDKTDTVLLKSLSRTKCTRDVFTGIFFCSLAWVD